MQTYQPFANRKSLNREHNLPKNYLKAIFHCLMILCTIWPSGHALQLCPWVMERDADYLLLLEVTTDCIPFLSFDLQPHISKEVAQSLV